MSLIHPEDEDMHYCDGSHRWIPPRGIAPHVWAAQVRAHMQQHLATMGGAPDRRQDPALIPRQKRRRPDTLVVPTDLGERVERVERVG